MDERVTHHKNFIAGNEVILVCRMVKGASKNLEDYQIIFINHSFLADHNLKSEDITNKSAKQLDEENIFDSFSWLSFLMEAKKCAEEQEFAADFLGEMQLCESEIFNEAQDMLFVRISSIKENKNANKTFKYINEAPYGIFISNNLGKIVFTNKQAQKITGYTNKEIIGKLLLEFVAKDDFNRAKKDLFRKRRLNERSEEQYKCVDKKNNIRYWQISSVKIDERHFVGFVNDVTELRASQEALKKSEEKFKLLFEDAPLSYHSLDENGNIITVNKAWCEMLGYSKEEAVGAPFNRFIVGDHVYYFMRKFMEFKERGVSHANFEMVKKSGERIKVHLDGRVSRDTEGDFIQTHCILNDVTAQLIAERKLIDSEKKYSAMIQNMSDVIMILGKNAEIIYASPNIKNMFGWDNIDLLGQPGVMLVHSDEADYISEKFGELVKRPDSGMKLEFKVKCKSGAPKNISLVAKNLMDDKDIEGVLLTLHDITERVKLEEEKLEMNQYVRNQQKLKSIGTLASGIAHEINNPINGIMNYSQVIIDAKNDEDIVENCANEILRETERVSGIVKNLLGFSGQQKQSLKKAEVNDVVEKTLSLINATLRHDGINLIIDIASNLPEIKCRTSQIQQVIMNLVTNARDSLNEKFPEADEDKIIRISAYQTILNGQEYVRIEVEDKGAGIPDDVQSRIFDPFFTTKSRHDGTGLGLSISYSIIKEHGGSLTFETKRNYYTRFFIDLPSDEK